MQTTAYAAFFNYDPSVYYLFIDAPPLPIGGANNYVLIYFVIDPEYETIADCQPVCYLSGSSSG